MFREKNNLQYFGWLIEKLRGCAKKHRDDKKTKKAIITLQGFPDC